MHPKLYTLTAGLMLCGTVIGAPLQQAEITKVVNDVRILEPGAAPRPAQLNEKIEGQQGIKTGAQSRTELVFSDKTLTRLGANTLFTFKNGTRDMDLQQGTMLLQVPKGAGGAKITTAAVTAAITGTTIMMEAQGAQASAASSPIGLLSTGQGLQVADPGSNLFRAYRPGETLEAGMSLRTDATTAQAVSPAPGTAVLLEPGTTVTLNPVQTEDKQQHVTVDLKAGNLYAAVSKRKAGNTDFRIRTPYGVAAARGTLFHFSLNLAISGGVGVAIEGTIEITDNNGGTGTATSGQGLSLNNGAVGGIQTLSPAQMSAFVSAASQLLHLAVDRGALSPELASRVSRALRDLKVPLSAAQQKLLDQAKGMPDHSSSSGAGTGNGYVKVIVLEGTLRLSSNLNLGESTLIGAGQMVIMPPNSPVIPAPVVVDVSKLVVTSKLISGMDSDSSSSGGPKVGTLDLKLVIKSVQDQKEDFNSGNLQQTPLFIPGGGTIVQVDTTNAIDNSLNGQQNGASPTPSVTPGPKNGPVIPNTTVDPFPINNQTTVVTDPTITTGTDVAQGTVWRSAFDGAFSTYLFGGTSAFDNNSQFNSRFLSDQSVFLFSNLLISGNPVIDTTGGPTRLALAANGSITTSGSPFNFDLSGLNQFSLMTKTGNLSIGSEATFTGGASTQSLLFYARGASSTLDFQGAADLTANANAGVDFVGAGNVNVGGSVKAPSVTAYSDAVLTISGTVEADAFDATANGGISFNPSALVTAGAVTLDNRSGTAALDLDPARFNLTNTTSFDVFSSATINLLGNLGLPSLVAGNLNTDVGIDINAAAYSIDAAALFISAGRDLFSGDLNVGTVSVTRDFSFSGSTLTSANSLIVTGGFTSTASSATVSSPQITLGTVTVTSGGNSVSFDASTKLVVNGAITEGANSSIKFTSPDMKFGSVVSASQLDTRSYSNESITLVTGAGLNLDKNLGTLGTPFGPIDGYNSTGSTVTGSGNVYASSLKIYGSISLGSFNGGLIESKTAGITASGSLTSSSTITAATSISATNGITAAGNITASNGDITSTNGGVSSQSGSISATGGGITVFGNISATNGNISGTDITTPGTITATDDGTFTLGKITASNIGTASQSTGEIWADDNLTVTGSVYVAGNIDSKNGSIGIGTLYGADLGAYTVKAISGLLRSIAIGSVNAGVDGSLDLSATDTITVTHTSGSVSLDAPKVVLDTLTAQRLVSALPSFGSTVTQLFLKGVGGLDFDDLTSLDIPNVALSVEGPITNGGGNGTLTAKSLTTTNAGANVTLSSLTVDGDVGSITVNGNLTLGGLSNVGGTIKTTNNGNFSSPVDYTAGNFDIAGDFTTGDMVETGITSLGYIKVGGILNATRSDFSAVNDITADSLDISYYTVSTSTGKIAVTNGITFGISGGFVEATTGDVSAGTLFGNGSVTAGNKLTVTGGVGLSNGKLTLVAGDLDLQGVVQGNRGDSISIQVTGINSPKIAGIQLKGLSSFFTPSDGGSFSLKSSADNVRVESGFISPSVDVTGGDQVIPDSAVVGNGGTFSIEADKGSISLKSATLNAGPGQVGVFANTYGGTGGTIKLAISTVTADTGTINVDNSLFLVGRATSEASETAETGGSIELNNNRTYGDGIIIQNSSQLFALTNQSSEGSNSGSITLTTGGALINVDNSILKASGEVRIFGGSVTLSGAEIAADSLKVKAFANGGVLEIGGGTLNGDSTLRLYAGSATSGLIHFVGDTTISSQYAPILAAKTVTLNNGITVNVVSSSQAFVFTDVPNFSAFSGGNGSTTGRFILNGNPLLSGAFVLSLDFAPDIDGVAPLSVPSKYGAPLLNETPNPFVINDTTLISTDPVIRTGNDYGFGRIWRGQVLDGKLTDYLFGGASAADTEIEFDTLPLPSLAVFKFSGLQITGNPAAVYTAGGSTNVLFVSVGNITTDGATFDFNVNGLNAVGFISQDGDITIDAGAVFSGSNPFQQVFIYDRLEGSTLTFNGEINLTNTFSGASFAGAGDVNLGGTINVENLNVYAAGVLTVNGTITVGRLELSSGGGSEADSGIVIDPSASITTGELYFSHESTTRVLDIDSARFGADNSETPASFGHFEVKSDNGITLSNNLYLTDETMGRIKTSNLSDLDTQGYEIKAFGVNLEVGRDFHSANTVVASAMIGRDLILSGNFEADQNLTVTGLLTTTGDGLSQIIKANTLNLGDIQIDNTNSTVSFVGRNQLDALGSLTITDPSTTVVFSSANMRFGFNVFSSQIDPHLVYTEFGDSYVPPNLTLTNGATLTLDGDLGDAVDRFGTISGTNLDSAFPVAVEGGPNLRGGGGYNLYSGTLNFTGSVDVSGLIDVQGGISANYLSAGDYILATGGDIMVANGIDTSSTVTATDDGSSSVGRIMAGSIGNNDIYAADITADGDIHVTNDVYTTGNVVSNHGNISIGDLYVSGVDPLNLTANDTGKTIEVGSITVYQGSLNVSSSTSITVSGTSGNITLDAPEITFFADGDPVRLQSSLPSFGPTVTSLLLDGLGGLTLDVVGGLHLSQEIAGTGYPDIELKLSGPLTFAANVQGNAQLDAYGLKLNGGIVGDGATNFTLTSTGPEGPVIRGINLKGADGDAFNEIDPQNGGTFSLFSNSADIKTGKIDGTLSVMGGDQLDATSNAVGNGGTFSITADRNSNGEVHMKDSVINAGPGKIGDSATTPYGGTGGTVNLSGEGVRLDNSTVNVGRALNEPAETTESGGNISLVSRAASSSGITIQNSSQLLALVNAAGSGGAINLSAPNAAGITVDNSTIKANKGQIKIVSGIDASPTSGSVTLTSSNISADVLKVNAYGLNGILQIGGGTLSGTNELKLYAAGATGEVRFVGNTTLASNVAPLIAGHTVTVNNGVLVNISGPSAAQIYTTNANFTGSGGNGSKSGQFVGTGASVMGTESAAPLFNGLPP